MGARTRRAQKIRVAGEFDPSRLTRELALPKDGGVSLTSWTLPEIFRARDLQQKGSFYLPSRMAEQMRTDDACAVAYENRLAPQRCVKVEIVPAGGARSLAIAGEACALFGENGVGLHPDTLSDVNGCLVDHGVAFGVNVATPREDGSRVDFEMKYFPIEYVRWDPIVRCYKARVDPNSVGPNEVSKVDIDSGLYGFVSGFEVPIVHGDGRWVIFQKHSYVPFRHGALLAAANVWARHAYAIRDWTKGSVSHGAAKVVGSMPVGVPIQNAGGLTPEASAMVGAMREVASGDSPAVLKPAGSAIDFVTNNSAAWQVWLELVRNGEQSAARIYLGTDGTLGTNGGAPGVDIGALFGVATTKVQGDLRCIERGILTGLIEPWCAMNFGDSTLAPRRTYMLPDGDADAMRTSTAQRRAAFFADIKAAHDNAFEVTQEYVDSVAESYGVEAPQLPSEATKAPTIMLAPTDFAAVVSVNEARASGGLGKLLERDGTEDPDGFLTVSEFEAKIAARAPVAAAPVATHPAG